MTSVFTLKGHNDNENTIVLVLEGKAACSMMEQEIFLGKEFAKTLYNTLPASTLSTIVDEINELKGNWD